ncbi:MAG: bifunctional precorrin-2 dehydrogenase/sirohydrochlorin ferrochelatase [Cyanobacteriota bacterium]
MSQKENTSFLPIYINVTNQDILIVGGGKVANRKIDVLLNYEANITIISPRFISDIIEKAQNFPERIRLIEEKFSSEHLENKDYKLVFVTTDDQQLNELIAQQAKHLGILPNISSSLEEGCFIMPAIIKEGDFQIAISTSGNSPLLAKITKQHLEDNFIPHLAKFTRLLGDLRIKIQERFQDDYVIREKVYNKVLNSPDVLNRLYENDIDIEEALNLIIQELN